MSERKKTGNHGEKLAVEYLKQKGHVILETNWRSGHDELDIISECGLFVVITEVKTQRSNDFQYPEDAVDEAKQKRIMRAAENYVYDKGIDAEMRFDIVAITLNGSNHKVLHMENAFYSTLE